MFYLNICIGLLIKTDTIMYNIIFYNNMELNLDILSVIGFIEFLFNKTYKMICTFYRTTNFNNHNNFFRIPLVLNLPMYDRPWKKRNKVWPMSANFVSRFPNSLKSYRNRTSTEQIRKKRTRKNSWPTQKANSQKPRTSWRR